ncbi:3'-5' exonuclease DinG [Paenibacillus sp. CECT 9249]|uniref:ATP-dependent DNA helicase DinG n=1 Tax=Paenibacillus sp. CECT 9249 TaxID=2845385 RepID=UPI001E36F1DC|nr:ATP-dependent DNA helicase DinG [Paenibacillus sp. CECT 9249]CAH0118789.1 3'-5' exonuclease DinG [Paenibacillus sp. CECT 9249]
MKFAVLDFETTGNQPADEIIQVGLAIINHDLTIEHVYQSFVKPSTNIPPFITQLTGITDKDVEEAQSLDDMMMELVPLLNDVVLIGHHVAFDYNFLRQALDLTGYLPFTGRILDTIDFLRILFPSLTSYQLGNVSSHFGVPHDRPHQADSDALATAHIWLKCMEKLDDLPLLTLQRLASLFEHDDSDTGWFIVHSLQEREMRMAVDEQAHTYFRQIALNVDDWTERTPPRSEEDDNPLADVTFEQFREMTMERLKERMPQFEPRKAQNMMFEEVMQAFEQDNHLMVEAGTGTGKSLGYLIPSIYYSVKNERKVVVSTHTINLQEQIRQRDVPLLESVLPVDFQVSVLKGRRHYLCLRKFEHKLNTKEFLHPKDDVITAAQMIVWLSMTEHGDDEELHFASKGMEFWDTVASDSDSCLNRACPWFRKCFYHRAKNDANLADVVITNHSMLFTDIRAEHRLLPGYDHLVIDEAHHLEEVAGKHLGLHLKYFSMVHTLTRLLKDSKSGQLPNLHAKLQLSGNEKAASWSETVNRMYPSLINIKEYWDKLTELLFALLPQRSNDGGATEAGQFVHRLQWQELQQEWEPLADLENNIYIESNEVLRAADKLINELKDNQEEFSIQSIVTDLAGLFKDMARHRDELRLFMKLNDPATVYWLEANANFRSKSLQMFAVPADVSRQLKEYFFDAKKSIIMTSATLTVDKSFQYFCEQLGLVEAQEQEKLRSVQLPSPFQYRKQALVVIPRDFPTLKGSFADADFIAKLVESLAETAVATQGRMLVLFTSYRMMKQVYEPLKEILNASNIQVLGQGIDSGNRSKLTRRFQDQSASVLLGTSSFWEGVDLPGDALTCLAIVRLPFQPPNHPLMEAKSDLLQKQKKNPFMKLSVPQAVIRFKQGFGRLVRTAQDRGIVIIYDTRVIESYYGKYFLYSLPGPKMEHMPLHQIVPRIQEWLSQNEEMEVADESGENI